MKVTRKKNRSLCKGLAIRRAFDTSAACQKPENNVSMSPKLIISKQKRKRRREERRKRKRTEKGNSCFSRSC